MQKTLHGASFTPSAPARNVDALIRKTLLAVSVTLFFFLSGCENGIIRDWYRPDADESVPELVQEDDYGCEITAYDFTRPPAVGFIGKSDGKGTQASPIPINIVYPYGATVPENEGDVRIFFSGVNVEYIGDWYQEADAILRNYVVTGKNGQKKYYRVKATPGESSGTSSAGVIGPFRFAATNGLIEGHGNTTAGSVAGVFVDPHIGTPPFVYELENSTDIFSLSEENGSWILRMITPLEARSPWVLRARITDSAGSYYAGPVQFTVYPPGTVREITDGFDFVRSPGTLWSESLPGEQSGFFTAPRDGSGTAPFTYTLIEASAAISTHTVIGVGVTDNGDPHLVTTALTTAEDDPLVFGISRSRNNDEFQIRAPGEEMSQPNGPTVSSPGNILQIGPGGLTRASENPYHITVKLEDSMGKVWVEAFTFSIAVARVMISGAPLGMRHYEAKLFVHTTPSFTAENFMDYTVSTVPRFAAGTAYSQGGLIDIMLGGTGPDSVNRYSLMLYEAGGDEYAVIYVNGLEFNNEKTAYANWCNNEPGLGAEVWHAFTDANEFQTFMRSPDSQNNSGQPYKLALAGMSMTDDLSWGKQYELYSNFKSPYQYIFDFRGCGGASFTSSPTHAMPERIVEVYLPDALTTLGTSAFQSCTGLVYVKLPQSLVTIGGSAFKDCTNLGATVFPKNIVQIQNSAFYNCTSLPSVDLSASNINTIGAGAFQSATAITFLDVHNAQLQKIEHSAFENCITLETADFTSCSSFTTIDPCAFKDCFKLEDLYLTSVPNLTTVGDSAFEECVKLNAADFSACGALTTIGNRAFYYCIELDTLALPAGTSGLRTVGADAFANTALTDVDFSNCPQLNALGAGVFSECYLLTHANLANTQITVIPASAFKNNVELLEVVLHDSTAPQIETIGNEAFINCSKLTRIDFTPIKNALKVISSKAFENCLALQTVNLKDCYKIETIGDLAFYNTMSLAEPFDLPASPPPQLKTIGNSAFEDSGITNFDVRSVSTPNFTINSSAFSGSAIQNALLTGSSIKTIGVKVFKGCSELVTADLSNCQALTSIGEESFDSAFTNSGALPRTADISNCPLLTSLGNALFRYSKVETVDFSDCPLIPYIPVEAFKLCTKLETVDLTGCTSLSKLKLASFMSSTIENVVLDGTIIDTIEGDSLVGGAFQDCKKLVTFDFPVIGGTLMDVQQNGFMGCVKLEMADFSQSTQPLTIGYDTFYGCSTMETLKLPASLQLVEEQAFFYCTELKYLYIAVSRSYSDLGDIFPGLATFAAIKNYFVLHVPNNSLADWNYFWRVERDNWLSPLGTIHGQNAPNHPVTNQPMWPPWASNSDPLWNPSIPLADQTYHHIIDDL